MEVKHQVNIKINNIVNHRFVKQILHACKNIVYFILKIFTYRGKYYIYIYIVVFKCTGLNITIFVNKRRFRKCFSFV